MKNRQTDITGVVQNILDLLDPDGRIDPRYIRATEITATLTRIFFATTDAYGDLVSDDKGDLVIDVLSFPTVVKKLRGEGEEPSKKRTMQEEKAGEDVPCACEGSVHRFQCPNWVLPR